MTAAGARSGEPGQFSMDAAVVRLLALAANKRATRSRPGPSSAWDEGGPITATPFRLFSIDDFPEPSPEWEAAHRALQAFAGELVAIGGMDLMIEVYDEAAERHGYRAVVGVSASWDGCHGWWH